MLLRCNDVISVVWMELIGSRAPIDDLDVPSELDLVTITLL